MTEEGWIHSTLFSYNDGVENFLKRFNVIQWIVIALAVIVDIFIIVNACLPADPSSQESGWIVNLVKAVVNGIKPDAINESNIDWFSSFIRKLVGHFSLFVVSGKLIL